MEEKLLYVRLISGAYSIRVSDCIYLNDLFNKYQLNYNEFIEYCKENYNIFPNYNTYRNWDGPGFIIESEAFEAIEYLESLIIMAKLTGEVYPTI